MYSNIILPCSDFRPLPFYKTLFPVSKKIYFGDSMNLRIVVPVTIKYSDMLTLVRNNEIKEISQFYDTFRVLVRTIATDNVTGRDVCAPDFVLFCEEKQIFRLPQIKEEEFFCGPIDVTECFKAIPTSNDITRKFVAAISKPRKTYCLEVFLTRKFSMESMLDKVKCQIPHRRNDARAILRNEFNGSQDGMAITESYQSLICPLTKQRLIFPVKASTCNHIHCFEAEAFLKLNDKLRANWKCPVCGQKINFQDLALDQFMMDLLLSVPQDCDNILIWSDLTYCLNYRAQNADIPLIDLTDDPH